MAKHGECVVFAEVCPVNLAETLQLCAQSQYLEIGEAQEHWRVLNPGPLWGVYRVRVGRRAGKLGLSGGHLRSENSWASMQILRRGRHR